MELYKGRPENEDGRLQREINVYDYLDKLGIEYFRTDHEAVDTMEECLEINKVLDAEICKNLFLCNRQQTQFYLILMPGDKPFKTKELSAQINTSRLSFGSAEKMLEYLDIQPGAVSLMGLINDKENNVQLIVDEDVIKKEEFGCHPCVPTSSIRMKTADAFGKFLKATDHFMTTVKLTGEL